MKIDQLGLLVTVVLAFSAPASLALTGQAGIREDMRAPQAGMLAEQSELRAEVRAGQAELGEAIRAGQAELRVGQAGLREETRSGQAELRAGQKELREEMGAGRAGLREEAGGVRDAPRGGGASHGCAGIPPGGVGAAGARTLRGSRLSRVLIAGCGDVGTALGLELVERGHDVFGARRSAHRLRAPLRPVPVDLTDRRGIERAVPAVDVVVYAVAAGSRDEEGVPACLRRRRLGPAGGAGGAVRASPPGHLRVEHLRLRRARRRVGRRDGAARAPRLRRREPGGGRAADAREPDPCHRGALRGESTAPAAAG